MRSWLCESEINRSLRSRLSSYRAVTIGSGFSWSRQATERTFDILI